jgi:hypothetical protein
MMTGGSSPRSTPRLAFSGGASTDETVALVLKIPSRGTNGQPGQQSPESSPAHRLGGQQRTREAVGRSLRGHGDVQPTPPPVPPAGASPCSMVLPEMVRLPPAGRVISTRRAWAFGEAGMVTCRTPSA